MRKTTRVLFALYLIAAISALSKTAKCNQLCLDYSLDGLGQYYCLRYGTIPTNPSPIDNAKDSCPSSSNSKLGKFISSSKIFVYPLTDIYFSVWDHEKRSERDIAIWTTYNYVTLAGSFLWCASNATSCYDFVYEDARCLYNADSANGFLVHLDKMMKRSREETSAVLFSIGKITSAGTITNKFVTFSSKVIYPITEFVNSAKVIGDIYGNRTAIYDSVDNMNKVPHLASEILDPMYGRLYWLGSIRTVAGAIALSGGAFKKAEAAGDVAIAISRVYGSSIASISKEIYESAFSFSLTIPLFNGINRWWIANFAEDSTAIVVAQAITTIAFASLKYNPKIIAIDLAINIALNHEAYWNGTKSIYYGAVESAYQIGNSIGEFYVGYNEDL